MTRIFQANAGDKEGRGERKRDRRISKELAIQCASIFVSWLLSAIKRYKTTRKKTTNTRNSNDDALSEHAVRWSKNHFILLEYTLTRTHTHILYIIKNQAKQQKQRAIYRSFLCLMGANVRASSCVRQVYCLFFKRKNP